MDTTALIVPSDTLRLKLAIWESRLTYARITKKIAAA